MVATFRASFGRHLSEPAWISFVDRLRLASPEFAAMWAMHDVASPATRIKTFIQNLGERTVHATATSLAISATPEARIIVYAPVTEGDRALLAEMSEQPPRITLCPYHAARAASAGGPVRR